MTTTLDTSIQLRPPAPEEAGELGRICYEGFKSIADKHSFPPDFPSPEVAAGMMGALIDHPAIYGVVAEKDGRILGSNFLDERSPIDGVGPITVDPASQDAGVGRALMENVVSRSEERGSSGIRLLQGAYHTRSLSLYAKLGFVARETLAVLQGPAIGEEVPGHAVRPARLDDVEPCNRLCEATHGFDREGELTDAIVQGAARVVEHDGRIAGYTTSVAFFGHSVAETNDALKALIGAATQFGGPGLLLPPANVDVFRWCTERGLRVVMLMTLMTRGAYREPSGPFLTSVLY